jgi:nicotinamide-nucleotide amidase
MIIVSIGNEILYGKTVNTNAPFISDQLNKIGIEVQKVITISDQKSAIESTLNQVFLESDLVIVTGGLGPTKDDITKNVICEYFKTPLIIHQPTLDHITQMFKDRGYALTEVNAKTSRSSSKCKCSKKQ